MFFTFSCWQFHSIWWGLQLLLTISGHFAITCSTTESYFPPLSCTTAHVADRNRIVSCLFGWWPSCNYAPAFDWQWDEDFSTHQPLLRVVPVLLQKASEAVAQTTLWNRVKSGEKPSRGRRVFKAKEKNWTPTMRHIAGTLLFRC